MAPGRALTFPFCPRRHFSYHPSRARFLLSQPMSFLPRTRASSKVRMQHRYSTSFCARMQVSSRTSRDLECRRGVATGPAPLSSRREKRRLIYTPSHQLRAVRRMLSRVSQMVAEVNLRVLRKGGSLIARSVKPSILSIQSASRNERRKPFLVTCFQCSPLVGYRLPVALAVLHARSLRDGSIYEAATAARFRI